MKGVLDFLDRDTGGVGGGFGGALQQPGPRLEDAGGSRAALAEQVLDALLGGEPAVGEPFAEAGRWLARWFRCTVARAQTPLSLGDHRVQPRFDLVGRHAAAVEPFSRRRLERLDCLRIHRRGLRRRDRSGHGAPAIWLSASSRRLGWLPVC